MVIREYQGGCPGCGAKLCLNDCEGRGSPDFTGAPPAEMETSALIGEWIELIMRLKSIGKAFPADYVSLVQRVTSIRAEIDRRVPVPAPAPKNNTRCVGLDDGVDAVGGGFA